MDKYLEIATSYIGKSITFFIGTGFSRYLTNNKAPSWLELIIEATKRLDLANGNEELFNNFFEVQPDNNIKTKFDLLTCAQILELKYKEKEMNLKEEICKIINENINSETINKDKLAIVKQLFQENPDINIITTNYDNLICESIFGNNCRTFIQGAVRVCSNTGINVFHIHGSISNPESIVLTTNDYFEFQHRNNYFSRKLYTLLQETTTVVLGYSLGDFNLNSILNEARNTRDPSIKTSDIFYITRDIVDNTLVEFYSYTYGINVIQYTEIDEFIENLLDKREAAKKILEAFL